MKHFFTIGIMVTISLALLSCAMMDGSQGKGHTKPQMDVAGPVKLDAKGVLNITGNGFRAGSEVALLFTTDDGVQSDIGYALDPMPKAGDDGSWTTKWSYGRYVKKKLVKEGGYKITAVDQDFNLLCETAIQFVK